MIRVDCQSHVFPKSYGELLKQNHKFIKVKQNNQDYIITYGDLQKFNLNLRAYDLKEKIKDMDNAKIDISVISVNIPGPELLTTELGIEGAIICNNYIAELCSKYPNRFIGLATLPLQNIPVALKEFDRAINDLKLRGIILFSNINGKPIDSPDFEPLYEHAEKLKIPLVLHPTIPVWGKVIKDYSMIPMFGLMVDTSIAMLRLILNGVLERHPDLLIVHPHCGGVLPYLMPRIEEQTKIKKRGIKYIKKSPKEYYKKVYIDLMSPSTLSMQYVYEFSDIDYLLFSSDHPWVKIKTMLNYLNNLKISKNDKDKILGLNACKLFKIY